MPEQNVHDYSQGHAEYLSGICVAVDAAKVVFAVQG